MWLLILQFVLHFPAFLKTIMELWKLIKTLNGDEKAAYVERLKPILKTAIKDKVMPVSEDVFKQMRDEILAKG